MDNNKIPFLDTVITLENNQLELYQYRKPTDSECVTNYKYGISPKSYKNSLLTGEIYRVYNCTTSEKAQEEGLKNLERIFKKNLYPAKLISDKIMEIKARNFGPNPNKAKRLEEFQNPNITNVTISLPYTSFRCSTVASKIHKILYKYTPNFKLRIAFSTQKLSSIILPTLKPKKEPLMNSNLVYKFTCNCNSTYIGHTKCLFETRIHQHRTYKTSHVFKHITQCPNYKTEMHIKYGSGPTQKEQREFIKDHFQILEKNLYNYYSRVTHEGLLITLQTPDLNKQQKHRSMSLVCECIKSKLSDSSKFIDDKGL